MKNPEMKSNRISVIIPTRQRCDTLASCLRTVTQIDDADLEIIVSDNASTDSTRDVVFAHQDSRVRYINPNSRLSMSTHWEYALGHATGDWVTILGDDDGLLPTTLATVRNIIRESSPDFIRSDCCGYLWPIKNQCAHGELSVPTRSGWDFVDAKHALTQVLRGNESYRNLPVFYTGSFASKSFIESMKDSSNRLYRSLVPDVYTGVRFSRGSKRFVASRTPLAINGASHHSTGNSHCGNGDKTAAKLFAAENDIPFHKDIPLMRSGEYPPSVHIITYESFLQCADAFPEIFKPLCHRTALRNILLSAGNRRNEITQWGQDFATQHGLDFEKIVRHEFLFSWAKRLSSVTKKIWSQQYYTRVVGSAENPIHDVYAASRLVGRIRDSHGHSLQTACSNIASNLFAKALEKNRRFLMPFLSTSSIKAS